MYVRERARSTDPQGGSAWGLGPASTKPRPHPKAALQGRSRPAAPAIPLRFSWFAGKRAASIGAPWHGLSTTMLLAAAYLWGVGGDEWGGTGESCVCRARGWASVDCGVPGEDTIRPAHGREGLAKVDGATTW